ncbi:hypothetical protein [Herpetosiphon giganteus]|uniref:hypothetical protein n=1 Tax=Herpetosiphon giganteus TaxID=2029754 RepID=UPI001957096F|nr:hypothetical protein [Herpetosiphon giganteus]MBM7843784.1 hypothetical protein [Herpetosiphon giganteus]
MSDNNLPLITGPISYRNWKYALSNFPKTGGFEFPLFTDAHITSQLTDGIGPYKLINTIAIGRSKATRPSIILRTDIHINEPLPDMNKTNIDAYHSGYFQDEITALVSLCMGIRLKAGGETREFESDDLIGRPIAYKASYDPVVPIIEESERSPVIPNIVGEHSLEDAKLLTTIPMLTSQQAITLIRAARLYQDALWIAETESELSWIMLTSAIETVAGFWKNELVTPVDKLKLSRPELVNILMEAGGEELVIKVAEEIAPYMGATKTFIDFILYFLPAPPEPRPSLFTQLSWEHSAMKKTMKIVYKYRSQALHGGTPFPAPMCMPPRKHDGNYAEIPLGLAMSTKGAVWLAKDTPILLNTFEYIVRHTILNWWRSIIPLS